MYQVIVFGDMPALLAVNLTALSAQGFALRSIRNVSDLADEAGRRPPDLVLLPVAGEGFSELGHTVRLLKQRLKKPVILTVTQDLLPSLKYDAEVADFVVLPATITEIILRMRRLLAPKKTVDPPELSRYGDLSINTATCEVCLQDLPVTLTFKEYEVLKYLVANRNRVLTREALLDAVWGYNFYGGDRTVDVHIRRLRSKIEDSGHTFINTVRNIGYRFHPRKLSS
jgi:two-component system, OmpR family, alkaline phosphatase synthesis response regulator PhoP